MTMAVRTTTIMTTTLPMTTTPIVTMTMTMTMKPVMSRGMRGMIMLMGTRMA